MSIDNLLHKALEKTDWDFVSRCFRSLGLKYYDTEHIPTKKELVTDLTEIIEATFELVNDEDETFQIVTPHWIVCLQKNEDSKEYLLEVIFTPLTLFASSKKDKDDTTTINHGKLKQRIDIALKKENYELAAKIQEVLDNYNTKTKP